MERPAPIRSAWLRCESVRPKRRATSEKSRSVERIKFVGLAVHAETIAVAVAEQDGEVRSVGVISNRGESVRKLVKKLGPVEELQFCYEAGPTGYVLYWQLTALGGKCEVVAPTLVPVDQTNRNKTPVVHPTYRAPRLLAVVAQTKYSGQTIDNESKADLRTL